MKDYDKNTEKPLSVGGSVKNYEVGPINLLLNAMTISTVRDCLLFTPYLPSLPEELLFGFYRPTQELYLEINFQK